MGGGGIYTTFDGTTSVTGGLVINNTNGDTFTEPGGTLIVVGSIIGTEYT